MPERPIYVVVTPFFPTPESWRGPFVFDFVRAVMRTGRYDVRVFVCGRGGDYEYHGVKVHRFRWRMFPMELCPFLLHGLNRRTFLRKAAAVGIDWNRVAVFHTHEINLLALDAAVKRLNPSVTAVHHFHSMGQPHVVRTPRLGLIPLYSTYMYCYFRRLLEQVDVPVFVSRRQRDMFGLWHPKGFLGPTEDLRARLWFGRTLRPVALKRREVLYNGIDRALFRPEASAGDRAGFVVGDVANFIPSKDQATLIRAVARLKDRIPGLKCLLVGSGPTLASCRALAERLGLAGIIAFCCEMDHHDLPAFYRGLDLFVSPSWAESFGCTVFEAVACGTPAMGCEGGAVCLEEALPASELVHWLVPPRDDAALAERIFAFYEHRVPQRLAGEFDIDRLVPAFLDRLEDAK